MDITRYARSRPPSRMTARAKALLGRYPDLNEQELAALRDMVPRLRTLDVGLITADDRLSRKFVTFRRDHGPGFESQPSWLIALLSLSAIAVVGTLWWLLAPTLGS